MCIYFAHRWLVLYEAPRSLDLRRHIYIYIYIYIYNIAYIYIYICIYTVGSFSMRRHAVWTSGDSERYASYEKQ